jgi:Ribbon-helix-helix protein, copG family
MKRTQIYLEEAQQEKLRLAALIRGTTVSAVIREALDRYLAKDSMTVEEKRAKIRELGEKFRQTPAFEGIDPVEYVDELRARGARKLESYRDGNYRYDSAD